MSVHGRGNAVRASKKLVTASVLVAGLVVNIGESRAQTTVNVAVDATAAGAPLQRVWPFFGYDEVNYSTMPEGRVLLKTLADSNTARVYVRTHFLLNTGDGTPSLKWGSTNAYTEDAMGAPIYSWNIMDGVMDAITSSRALPLAEIGFMPQALSIHPTPYQNTSVRALDGGCFYPPKDYDKWGALIRAWATHAKGRYPDAERLWLWELWNEPDLYYWNGTFAEYAKLYDYTEAALHGVMPAALLGGPAVISPGSAFLKDFLQHCSTGTNAVTGTIGTRLDLITFHAKGGVGITGGNVRMNLGNQMRLHRDGFDAVAAVAPFKQKPIYITEADPDGCAACSASEIPADAYRNSPAYGAYEIAMMKRSLELGARTGVNLAGVLTWAFTFPNSAFFAGYRALTTNGITMPVLGAFKLLGSLDGLRMPLTSSGALPLDSLLAGSVRGAQPDVDAMATLNGDKVQVLVWNYHDDLVAMAPAAPVHLTLKVPASFGARVSVANLRVDETHGDAYTVWVAQGRPAAPSAAQLIALRAAMEPSALGPEQTIAVAAGSVAIDFSLPRFGVSLLTITPGSASDDAGAMVDAAAPRPDGGGAIDAVIDPAASRDGNPALDAAPETAPAVDAPGPPVDAPPVVVDAGAPDVSTPVGPGSIPGADAKATASSACSCDTAVTPGGAGLALILAAIAAAVRPRRRRRQRTTPELWISGT